MALKHNKKRNSGMLSEFFANHIANAFVNANKTQLNESKRIWAKYTASNTELRKELRLFEALGTKKFASKEVAYNLLSQTKLAAKKINKESLEREKTALIREVNDKLSDHFFDHEIENYTDLASVQIFLNYHETKQILESVINPAMSELEDKIVSFMCRPQSDSLKERAEKLEKIITGNAKTEVDGLVVNIMRDKLNKKFGETLNEEQKVLLQKHVYGNNDQEVSRTLTQIKENSLRLIDNELNAKRKGRTHEAEKLSEIKNLIQNDFYDTKNVDDDNVTFYMMVSGLNEQLSDEEEKKK